MDVLGIWVGAILTLLVFSYLLGDNPLFRLAQAIFVGVAIGYGLNVAVFLVLLRRLFVPLAEQSQYWLVYFIPLILGLLLLLKSHKAWAPLGNVSIAFLFGVGAALAIGGASSGLLVQQVSATAVSLSPFQDFGTFVGNCLLVLGTIGSLLSFRFVTVQNRSVGQTFDRVVRAWSRLGRGFILVAFGAIFADTAVSRVSILISRFYFLLHDWLAIVR
jgi:hypothetical protein